MEIYCMPEVGEDMEARVSWVPVGDVRLSCQGPLCHSQVPTAWFPAISREARTGSTKSPDCWEIAPALINQETVSSACDIYQTSFTLICQYVVRLPCWAQSNLVRMPRGSPETKRRGALREQGGRGDREIRRGSWGKRGKSKCSENARLFC